MEKNCGFGKFVKGFLIGASLGVLFAPKKGSETRSDLVDKASELLDKAKEVDIDDVSKIVEKKIADIKKELTNLDKEKVMSLAKEQAEHIKSKCDDLVEYAISNGTPIVKKTAEAARVKAIEVLKVTLANL